ncbi:hypothetical protein LINPERPRIM_LOCUS16666, partial [Linum perenne]
SRDWEVTIQHIYRKANNAADYLANLGHEFDIGTHDFYYSLAYAYLVLLIIIRRKSLPYIFTKKKAT